MRCEMLIHQLCETSSCLFSILIIPISACYYSELLSAIMSLLTSSIRTKSVPTRPGMGHAHVKIGASRVLRWRYRHKLSPTNVLSAII